MTGPISRISSEVSFDQDGKHQGFLRLPHSVHRSAYGWIPIPVASIKNGEGPKVLLMAGNHGDEYEGQIGLSTLLRETSVKEVHGQLIILPSANFPAAMAGLRTSPVDEGNLNRVFPGDPNGSVTEQIACYIEHVLLAQVDYVFDLHSGGSSLMYIPSAGCRRSADSQRMAQALEVVRLFGAPAAYVLDSQSSDACTLAAAAGRQNVIHFGAELGGGGALTPSALRVAVEGTRRVLKYLGVLDASVSVAEPSPTQILQVRGTDYFVYAPDSGMFEPTAELGDMVQSGQQAGRIHFCDTPWREPSVAVFKRAGVVLCKRMMCRTERGDCLFHLGAPFEP
ncbi:MAG: deacylase [Alcaligenaceae bacterium]|nr:MAG: deacylase [Alcaligenaceae bacterium]